MLPVVRAACRYRAPLRYDDLALIRTEVHGWTWSTLSFRHEIHSDETGELCATGEIELGCVRMSDWKPSRLPNSYHELLRSEAPDAWGRRPPT